jgi:beta-galactosidase GanA
MRQNMDTDSPAYRFYAERLIRHIVAHYKDNPTVIGWQLDNETAATMRPIQTSSLASSIISNRNLSRPRH